jgi:hypothetical protein
MRVFDDPYAASSCSFLRCLSNRFAPGSVFQEAVMHAASQNSLNKEIAREQFLSHLRDEVGAGFKVLRDLRYGIGATDTNANRLGGGSGRSPR